MRRVIVPIAVLLACLLFLQGCTFEIKSVDSLIRAPKLTGENAAIQSVFEQAVGKNIILVSPSAGEYKSSYVTVDFDNDSTDETIVFYSKKADELTVRVHFLDNINGQWVSVGDVSTGGSEIYEMRLESIDGDTVPEIFITWSVTDTNRNKYLTVYKRVTMDSNGIAAIATIQIEEYKVLDINVDNVNEILYTYFDSSTDEDLPFAAVQRYDDETASFLQIGEAAINPLATTLKSYSYDMKEGVNRIYIDCMRSNGLYFTELLCWDTENAMLLAPLSETGNSATQTSRASAVYCKDIEVGGETDGLVEIPFEESPKGSVSIGDASGITGTVVIRTWFSYSDGELVPRTRRYVNVNDGYELIITSLYGNIDIVQYESSGVTEVFENNDGERGELLFTITAKPIGEQTTEVSITKIEQQEKEISISVTPAAQEQNISEEDILSLIVQI